MINVELPFQDNHEQTEAALKKEAQFQDARPAQETTKQEKEEKETKEDRPEDREQEEKLKTDEDVTKKMEEMQTRMQARLSQEHQQGEDAGVRAAHLQQQAKAVNEVDDFATDVATVGLGSGKTETYQRTGQTNAQNVQLQTAAAERPAVPEVPDQNEQQRQKEVTTETPEEQGQQGRAAA